MSPDPRVPANSRAILIGVSHYKDTTYLSYPAVANSLHGMLSVLTDPDLCGWAQECVEPILDPTNGGQLIGRLRKLAAQTTGVLLFYFVGHGVVTEHGELCLAISDTDANNPDTTGLEYSKIKNLLYCGSPATTRIAILDCCFSGRAIGLAAAEGQLAHLSDVAGTYTLTAADDIAHVVCLNQQADVCTSFTGELLELIRSGIPKGPSKLTLGELYPLLSHRLVSKGLPRPNQCGTDNANQFVFTRNAVTRSHTSPRVLAPRPVPIGTEAERLYKRPRSQLESDVSDSHQKVTTLTRRAVLPGSYPEMIPVPDGDQPQFWLGQHPVTNGQFHIFLQAEENAEWRPTVARRKNHPGIDQGYLRHWHNDDIDSTIEYHPVVNVSVQAACAYARWVGRQVGRPVRLPHVSEWDQAAIAGRPDRWLDEEVSKGRVNYNRALGKLAKVGEFGANPYGISDLLGNVFDLCLDENGSPILCGGTFRSTRERLIERLTTESSTRCRTDVGFRCAYDKHGGG